MSTRVPHAEKQARHIIEGLAWWGVVASTFAAFTGYVENQQIVLMLAALGAIVTVYWFHLTDDPFRSRFIAGSAIAVYLATISAINYYTGGVASPMFILWLIPLLAAFFLFRPSMQIIFGAVVQTAFTAQFLAPFFLEGLAPDWITYITRSLQLLALGAFSVLAARAVRSRLEIADTKSDLAEEQQEKLMEVVEAGARIEDSDDHHNVVYQSLHTATEIFESHATFLVRWDGDRFQASSQFLIKSGDSYEHLREEVVKNLPAIERMKSDQMPSLYMVDSKTLGQSELAAKYGITACALVPLYEQDELTGVFGTCRNDHKEFTDNEQRLLSLYAREIGIHLHSSLKKVEEMPEPPDTAIPELIHTVSTSIDLDYAVEATTRFINGRFKSSGALTVALHSSGSQVESNSVAGDHCNFPADPRKCPSIRNSCLVSDMTQGKDRGINECEFMMRGVNWLCHPIVQNDTSVGVIQAVSIEKNPTEVAGEMDTLAASLGAPFRGLSAMEDTSEQFYDQLTESHSWAFFRAQAALLHDLAGRTGRPYSLAVMDIDSRDDLLDSVGQTVVDQIMRSISVLIDEDLLSGGILGRLENGSFAICLPESKKDEAFAWINQIRLRVEKEISVTVSSGVMTSFGGGSIDENIVEGMTRMEKARDFGGNSVCAT